MKGISHSVKDFLQTRWFELLAALLVFVPLLFLNIRSDHDWGGDFAQYLVQAKNIATCKPMAETFYVYNETYAALGPAAYPPGFPLLLAPVVALAGYSMPTLNVIISLFLVAIAISTIMLLRRQLSLAAAITVAAVFFYNPNTFEFKSQIMADIPFSLLILIFLILSSSASGRNKTKWILAGIVGGFAATMKTAGITVGVAMAVYICIRLVSGLLINRSLTKSAKEITGPQWGLFAWLVVFIVVSNLFSAKGVQGAESYLRIFNLNDLISTLNVSVYSYVEAIRTHFLINPFPGGWLGLLVGAAFLTFAVTGFLMAMNKHPGIIEYFFIVYVIMLLVYPYTHAGFRFLLPLAPILLMYAVRPVAALFQGKWIRWVIVACGALILYSYQPSLAEKHKSRRIKQEGPYRPEVQLAFEKVKSLTNENHLIVFLKPRVLAWIIERPCMSHHPAATPEAMEKIFLEKGATHFLVYTGLHDPALHVYLSSYPDAFDCIYADEKFTFYRRKN